VQVVAIVVLLIAVSLLDQATGLFHLTVLYVIPIIIAVWGFGLSGGLITGAVALGAVTATHWIHRSPTLTADIVTDFVVFAFAALVIDRLRRELTTTRALEARRDFDLRIAREVQNERLSPVPADARFDIASALDSVFELGGDYYKFDSIAERLFLCVGDISGKGTSAALFATLLDETLVDALSVFDTLADLVEAVNRRMYNSMPPEMFVTMYFALLGDSSIQYANAGHVRPLLYDAAEATVSELSDADGLPLGVAAEIDVAPVTRPFLPGSMLLMCTDGVTESPRLLARPELLQRMFEDTLKRGPQAVVDRTRTVAEADGQTDDVTVVCVRRRM